MEYTALHRLLNRPPGPIDDDLLNAAIEARLGETDDLDWKRQLPERKGLGDADSSYLHDIAAFANGRGGVIVYGVNEKNRFATGRTHAGDWSEGLERSLTQIPASHLHPPVLGVQTFPFGPDDLRAVAVVVPASVDRPHLIGSATTGFRARVRNGADSTWMSERDLEAAYRGRAAERQNASDALDRLYADAIMWAAPAERAWGVAVARPRLPVELRSKPDRKETADIIGAAGGIGKRMAKDYYHPLKSVNEHHLRPGLRRWIARNQASAATPWLHAYASVHFDGSVTLTAALGGHHGVNNTVWQPHEFQSWRLETLVCDLFGLVKAAADRFGGYEYDVRLGIAWESAERLLMAGRDNFGYPYTDGSVPLAAYTPVEATVDTDTDEAGMKTQAREFATDCINQGGLEQLTAFDPDARSDMR
ncbi:ATP-binding protein [Glycomyces sp. A-F 0318]|uniref:AlbA family DNA-binding domain-containing protein n=1 Tax=Glycomyces amatae TaxID=2881355 RepID=UPI001E3CEA97|nr:ATP-binding protein [Glycomyces amatae]MCD0445841.1 ATP-binding protein [Glycomyces amatae]